MARLRLALLNASLDGTRADTSRNFRRELNADLAEFTVSDGRFPPPVGVEGFDGVVVTGSGASTYWDAPWIDEVREWLREAYERGLPILGVCFGHQLLASALGGTVEAMGDFEIGYREVRHVGETPLFEGIDERFTVFTTHGDTVTALPEGATVIAENDYGLHGFRIGHAFGVQFHPEYDAETASTVTRSKEFLGEERIERVLAGITDENYARACEAKRLFENFTEHVRRVRPRA
ncbi:type 1 glutamine amidotransferase [Halomarina pelagica]|uniref:type 1 glutamine amidotransferase n=1 Tax=Halomarina pelagica TaxID=2961599 RepID=UPI0020C21DA1|nr:type 1 glutamine amidotransferase [Halomarina sp. BND7]